MEVYFSRCQLARSVGQISNLPYIYPKVVQLSNVTYDERATYEDFIRGELYFVDGSALHLRDFC